MVQLLRLPAFTGGFDPWSGNQDPTCPVVWPNKKNSERPGDLTDAFRVRAHTQQVLWKDVGRGQAETGYSTGPDDFREGR